MTLLEEAKAKLQRIIAQEGLAGTEPLTVTARQLTPQEAIGDVPGDEWALLRGKEGLLQATFRGAVGQAFTSQPGPFKGTLNEVLALPLTSPFTRAVFVATLNAVLRALGRVEGTVHCRNEEPPQCGQRLAQAVRAEFGPVRLGIIGYQPGIVAGCVAVFGAERVRVTDLQLENIGQQKFGVEIWDGARETERLLRESQVVLATGTTLINGTLDSLREEARRTGVPVLFYGTTIAGVAHLCGLRRLCYYAR